MSHQIHTFLLFWFSAGQIGFIFTDVVTENRMKAENKAVAEIRNCRMHFSKLLSTNLSFSPD